MKMNSKLRRINIEDKPAYQVYEDKKINLIEGFTEEQQKNFDKLDEFHQIIFPWQQFFSKKKNKHYFYNPETKKSLWKLPQDIQTLLDKYYTEKQKIDEEKEKKNFQKFIPKKFFQQISHDFKHNWKSKEAKVQKVKDIDQQIAYEEGDEEYNIWYDKKIEDEIIPQREAAKSRCNPFTDCGYTFADTHEKSQLYFCFHFARGNCYQGNKCKFYHHVPTLEECLRIENSKDIFGRGRFSSHRKDKMGIGNFLKETRTLRVSDFCIPSIENSIIAAYEVLWRQFSLWGDIEDIYLLPQQNIAYIRYAHRCMAEFAKECMIDQSLDNDEVITIQWTESDCLKLDEAENYELQKTIDDQLQKEEEKQQKYKKNKKKKMPTQEKQQRTINDYEKEQEKLQRIQQRFLDKQETDNKIAIAADYNLFEQKLKQRQEDQSRLNQALKKIKTDTNLNDNTQSFTYSDFFNQIQLTIS